MIKKITDKLKSVGFVHVFSTSVLHKIIAFLSGIILIRIVPKDAYGIYTYAASILGYFTLIAGPGLTVGVLLFCSETADNPEKRDNIYGYSCTAFTIFNFFIGIAVAIFALTVPLPIRGANLLLLLYSFYPMVSFVHDMQKVYQRSNLNNRGFSYSNLAASSSLLIFSILFAFSFEKLFGTGEQGLIYGHYAAYIATAIFSAVLLKAPFRLGKYRIDKNTRKSLFKVTVTAMFNNGLAQLMTYIDISMIGFVLLDENIVASYKIASMLPASLVFIPQAVETCVFPYFVRHREDKRWVKKNYTRLLLSLGAFNVIVSGIMIALAPLIISIVFGKQYLDAVPVFRLLSLNFCITGTINTFTSSVLVTMRKLNFNLIVTVISCAVNFVSDYFFIRWWGSSGAAISTLIVSAVSALLLISLFLHTINKKSQPLTDTEALL